MPMHNPDPTRDHLTAVVGRRLHRVPSWAAVSVAYRKTINALDLGASRTPHCDILDDDGLVVAHVSYNGRVWPGPRQDWHPLMRPLYEPSPLT